MIIASQKRKENIAEYLLYMWQIEDIIRAYNLDIEKIDKNIISNYTSLDSGQADAMHDWYESLIDMMRRENVIDKGHIQLNKNIIIMLTELHTQILNSQQFPTYNAEFYKTLPYIVELRAKAGEKKAGEIESCFNALYGVLMLKLQRKEISKETTEAISQISSFISLLSSYFKKDSENNLFQKND